MLDDESTLSNVVVKKVKFLLKTVRFFYNIAEMILSDPLLTSPLSRRFKKIVLLQLIAY